jgi:type IV secretory pathway TraG/TraD family ATPase VirD4
VCIITLGFDILQYKFGERVVDDAFDRAEKSASKKAAYYADSFAYRAQNWCYRSKVTITALNALTLIVLVGRALL